MIAMSVRRAAQQTDLTPWAVYQATQCGDLPARRVGKQLLVTPDDVAAWLGRMPRVVPIEGSSP